MPSLPDLYTLIQDIDTELEKVMRTSGAENLQSIPAQEELTKYILVATGSLHVAIAVDGLAEVGPLPLLTFLPNLPRWIQGIVNVRSEIISVIDLAGFLNLSHQDACTGNRFVVLQYRKQKVGVRLDTIVGTMSRGATETKPLEYFANTSMDISLFTAGLPVENTLYYILDVRKFLTTPRLLNYSDN